MKTMKIPKDYINTVEGYRQFREKVENTLEWIDFKKIAKVMKFLNWHWAMLKDNNGNSESRVPTENEIRTYTRDLFIECVENAKADIWSIGTGGITVKTVVYDPEEPDIEEDLKQELLSNPDDFEHRVDLLFSFSIEESVPMY